MREREKKTERMSQTNSQRNKKIEMKLFLLSRKSVSKTNAKKTFRETGHFQIVGNGFSGLEKMFKLAISTVFNVRMIFKNNQDSFSVYFRSFQAIFAP